MEHNERCHHARQQLAQRAGREPAPPRSPAAPAGLLRPETTAVWSSPWRPLRHSSAFHVESAVVRRRRWYREGLHPVELRTPAEHHQPRLSQGVGEDVCLCRGQALASPEVPADLMLNLLNLRRLQEV